MQESALAVLRLVLAYGIGFFAPGYATSLLLRSRSPLGSALALSWLSLAMGTLCFQALGLGFGFFDLLAWQAVVALAAGSAWWRGSRSAPTGEHRGPAGDEPGWAFVAPLAASILLVGLLMLLRSTVAPLNGWDTAWRWDALALRIFELGNLDFYPPVSASDFRVYFYPDGFPPIVSIGYAFLYAAAGAPVPWAVGPLVTMQWISAVTLAWHAARHLRGSAAGWIAGALLATTPLFFRAVAIGQETGLTALAMAGTLLFLLPPDEQETREHRRGRLILAAAFAALGASARDYGAYLIAVGLIVLVWHRRPWREASRFAAVALLLAIPWYARTWWRTGNPLYSLDLGPFRSANPVATGILDVYAEHLGISSFTPQHWLSVGRMLGGEIPVGLVALVAGIVCFRRLGFLLLALLLATGTWLYSLGFSSGGVFYASRVLGAAAVPAAVLAGAALRPLAARRLPAAVVAAAVVAVLLWRLPTFASFPFVRDWSQWLEDPAVTLRRFERPIDTRLTDFARARIPPGSRLLSDNAYAHATLFGSGVEVVALWSPEVSFLFDPTLAPAVARDRLRAAGIEWLLLPRLRASDPRSLNLVYSSRFAFFRDTAAWQPVPAPFEIYRLPSANAP